MLRKFIIKFITPMIWKKSHARQVIALNEFSLIEKDSALQLLQMVKFIPDPRLKALVFQHVLEELFHADLFADVAWFYSKAHLETVIPLREDLMRNKHQPTRADLASLMAYVHVGEKDINSEFALYSKAASDSKLKNVFRMAADDEDNHAESTDKILLELCDNSRLKYLWLVSSSRMRRFYKEISSYSKLIGVLPLNLILSLLYFLSFALVRTLRQRMWMPRDQQLEIFKAQQKRFEKAVELL